LLAPVDLSLVARDSGLEVDEDEEATAAGEAVESGRCGLWPAECLEVTVVHSPSPSLLIAGTSGLEVKVGRNDQREAKEVFARPWLMAAKKKWWQTSSTASQSSFHFALDFSTGQKAQETTPTIWHLLEPTAFLRFTGTTRRIRKSERELTPLCTKVVSPHRCS